MRQLAFVLAGLASGFFSGSLGVGGAALATPLIRFLGVSPFLAIGTTVPSILPSAIAGSLAYSRAGLVDWRIVRLVAPLGGAGAFAGALVTRRVPGEGHVLMIATAVTILFLCIRILGSDQEQAPRGRPSAGGLIAFGALTGVLSGLLGIGGGFVMVPVFIRQFGLPIKVALGTSLAVISITVVPNVGGQWAAGNIDWPVAGLLAIGVVPGARLGARVSIGAGEKKLKTVLVVALAAVAIAYAGFETRALVR